MRNSQEHLPQGQAITVRNRFLKYSLICHGIILLNTFGQASEIPRYIFINTAPEVHWSAGNPESFSRELFDEIITTIDAPKNPQLAVGVSFIFDYFRYDLDSVRRSLRRYPAQIHIRKHGSRGIKGSV